VEALSTLGPHLGRWDPHDVVVDVSLQDRGGKEQRVTLRTSLPGLPPLVAVADNPDLTRALGEAKHELIRQIEHQKSEREPMNNRRLRSATIWHPDTRTP
jgi:ribosome-associated translation inhibitor RaiA